MAKADLPECEEMKLTDTTILETPEEARARVFRMDKIERRLAYLAQADKYEERILLSLDEAIAILETETQERLEIRRAG